MGIYSATPEHAAWHPAPVEVHEAARRIIEVCKLRDKATATALRFALDHPYVFPSTLVGMATQAEVMANLELLRMKSEPEFLARFVPLRGMHSIWNGLRGSRKTMAERVIAIIICGAMRRMNTPGSTGKYGGKLARAQFTAGEY